MTDNQKNIIGTILLNMSASTLPVTEEAISNLVDINDNMNTTIYGVPRVTPEEREEVIMRSTRHFLSELTGAILSRKMIILLGIWQQSQRILPNSGIATDCIC